MEIREAIERMNESDGSSRIHEVDAFLQDLWDSGADDVEDHMVEVGNESHEKPAPFTDDLSCAMALAVRLLDDGPIDIEVAHRTVGSERYGRAEICGPQDWASTDGVTPTVALLKAALMAFHERAERADAA